MTSAAETPIAVSKPPSQTDKTPAPVIGPLVELLKSRKAIMLILSTVGVFVLVALGKVSWAQAVTFLTVTLPAWALAHGVEEGLKSR